MVQSIRKTISFFIGSVGVGLLIGYTKNIIISNINKMNDNLSIAIAAFKDITPSTIGPSTQSALIETTHTLIRVGNAIEPIYIEVVVAIVVGFVIMNPIYNIINYISLKKFKYLFIRYKFLEKTCRKLASDQKNYINVVDRIQIASGLLDSAIDILDNGLFDHKQTVLFEDLYESKKHIIATSSMPIFNWSGPGFFYYLSINSLINLQKSGYDLNKFTLSNKHWDICEFINTRDECLVEYINNGGASQFIFFRFLFYSNRIYNSYQQYFESLIWNHTLFRIHCLPINIDNLFKLPGEKLTELVSLNIDINTNQGKNTVTKPYKLEKALKNMTFPDFMIVDNSFVWYEQYKSGELNRNNIKVAIYEQYLQILISLIMEYPEIIHEIEWFGKGARILKA